MKIRSSCHCGNISVTVFWPTGQPKIPIRACSCTFCRKHRALWTSHPNGRIEANLAEPALVKRYRFGTETAEFFICARCGAMPFVLSTISGHDYAAINTNCFEDGDAVTLSASVTNFDDETIEDRLSRRKMTWIPEVKIS